MTNRSILTCMFLLVPTVGWSQEIPNGKDAFIAENAVNIPQGRILLARQHGEYCAVMFTSSEWLKGASSAKYRAYDISTSPGFTAAQIRPREDEVYQKPPKRIIGRFAAAGKQDKIFCGKIILKWSGAPNNSGWVYLDDEKTIELAPTKWRDIRQVDVGDRSLRWFKYGDVPSGIGRTKLPLE